MNIHAVIPSLVHSVSIGSRSPFQSCIPSCTISIQLNTTQRALEYLMSVYIHHSNIFHDLSVALFLYNLDKVAISRKRLENLLFARDDSSLYYSLSWFARCSDEHNFVTATVNMDGKHNTHPPSQSEPWTVCQTGVQQSCDRMNALAWR